MSSSTVTKASPTRGRRAAERELERTLKRQRKPNWVKLGPLVARLSREASEVIEAFAYLRDLGYPEALRVGCPFCGVPPGVACIAPEGYAGEHTARWENLNDDPGCRHLRTPSGLCVACDESTSTYRLSADGSDG